MIKRTVLLFLFLFLSFCLAGQEGSDAREPDIPGEDIVPTGEDSLGLEMDIPEVDPDLTGTPPAGEEVLEQRWLSRQDLLAHRNRQAYGVEDFELGPLLTRAVFASDDAEAAYRMAASFLDALLKGDVRRELILMPYREVLGSLLTDQLSLAPDLVSYRLGQFTQPWKGDTEAADGQVLRINVKVAGEIGFSAGEMVVRENEGRWWLDDWQLNLEDLKKEQPDEEPPFRIF